MNIRFPLLFVLAWLLVAPSAQSADSIRTTGETFQGQITKLSHLEVTIKKSGTEKKVPVNVIRSVRFDGEPSLLNTARTAVAAGRYEDAVTALGRVEEKDIRSAPINQDVQYYLALANARLALTGTGSVKDAGSVLAAFIKANPESHHYLEACETVGDLLVAAGNPGTAKAYYDRLAQVPWPDYKMKATVASARAQLASGDADAAMKAFQSVIDGEATGPLADRQRQAATLGKARCLAAKKKYSDAIKLADSIIANADPDEAQLLAGAYNALGDAHRKAGRPHDALLAFLHVDLLFYTSPRDHIEALENLVDLWNEVEKQDRASNAAQTLRDRYGR